MGYFMRFLVVGQPVTFADLVEAFGPDRNAYTLEGDDAQTVVLFRGALACDITFNTPRDGLFEEEIQELTQEVEESDDDRRERVLDVLKAATQIVAVQVLFAARQEAGVLDPLWNWLSGHRVGLLQGDGEGYYEGNELVLEMV